MDAKELHINRFQWWFIRVTYSAWNWYYAHRMKQKTPVAQGD